MDVYEFCSFALDDYQNVILWSIDAERWYLKDRTMMLNTQNMQMRRCSHSTFQTTY